MPLPELVFRALPPSEELLSLAREQDALYRAVVRVAPVASKVVIERLANERRHRVQVRAQARGRERCGAAEYTDAAIALRSAFTELLRNTVDDAPCSSTAAA